VDAGMAALSVVLVILSYLCGSIPFGVVVARLTGGPDPRSQGSGRTGGTNALRTLGRRRAVVVVAGDVLKGAVPVLVARALTGSAAVEVLCGLAAVLGASRSIFLGFHGGRGVGTGVGTMLVIQPWAVLLATPVFIVVILLTRYVSLGSLLGSAAMVLFVVAWFLFANGDVPLAYPLYATIGCALVWLAHADNIDRLVHGTERKFDLGLLGRDDPAGTGG
jgi:glycerol-3-phosphate acyltransferase PlsY